MGTGVKKMLQKALEPWLLKQSLWNAVEGEQLSGLSVEVVKGHVAFSTFCSYCCAKRDLPSEKIKAHSSLILKKQCAM